jgi:cytochrome b subunit of formate dehydrogenase
VLTFIVLLVSGLLILDPTLRSAVTGGYALTLSAVHRWSGVAFAVVPAAIAAAAGARRVLAPAEWGRARGYVQSLHTVVTVAMVAGFTVSGALLWRRDLVSMAVFDRALELHDALTYVGAALLAVHLLDIVAVAFAARWRAARATTSP